MTKSVQFSKFQATGNDFIILDNRNNQFNSQDVALWSKLCDRKLGIGADGVLFVDKSPKYNFKMTYLNSDGSRASMCGNGARAISRYFYDLSGITNLEFETDAGIYKSQILSDNLVELFWNEINDIDKINLDQFGYSSSLYANTGVPHAVFEVTQLASLDLMQVAKPIRYSTLFSAGTNVNFIEKLGDNSFAIRTYERGVEGETLSCGTGTVASAVFVARKYGIRDKLIAKTKGGQLIINFDKNWSNVSLVGEVHRVFHGTTY